MSNQAVFIIILGLAGIFILFTYESFYHSFLRKKLRKTYPTGFLRGNIAWLPASKKHSSEPPELNKLPQIRRIDLYLFESIRGLSEPKTESNIIYYDDQRSFIDDFLEGMTGR